MAVTFLGCAHADALCNVGNDRERGALKLVAHGGSTRRHRIDHATDGGEKVNRTPVHIEVFMSKHGHRRSIPCATSDSMQFQGVPLGAHGGGANCDTKARRSVDVNVDVDVDELSELDLAWTIEV